MLPPVRKRLDALLVERGLVESHARAQALIRAGEVLVTGHVMDKPGMCVAEDVELALRRRPPYVSRGGYKLAAALDAFDLDPTGWICLDAGASAGGFTDVLLQRGARRIYAVDVGRGQLAWSLRCDQRVVNMERTDIRAVDLLPDPVQLATIDVAFISLKRVLPACRRLVDSRGRAIALIKPQFEASREAVPRGGIVRDPSVHRAVLQDVLRWCTANGWRIAGAMASPIEGTAGNREFLALLTMPSAPNVAISLADAMAQALGDDGPPGHTS